MSKARYYYDCPLAAAWMAKTFGMRFYDVETGGLITVKHILENCIKFPEIKKGWWYYILEDDLHLLEPREGDYILLPDILGFAVIDEVKSIASNGNIFTVSYKRPYTPGKKIIQRNNQPFHWPIKEEV